MIYNFDTDDIAAAIGALLIYCVYRSRDLKRFKVDASMWARIERFVKASAKRSQSLSEFVERLKPRLACEAIRATVNEDGYRDFLTGTLSRPDADPHLVLRRLYRETSLCVLLVRERLEREKAERLALEAAKLAAGDDDDEDGIEELEAA